MGEATNEGGGEQDDEDEFGDEDLDVEDVNAVGAPEVKQHAALADADVIEVTPEDGDAGDGGDEGHGDGVVNGGPHVTMLLLGGVREVPG